MVYRAPRLGSNLAPKILRPALAVFPRISKQTIWVKYKFFQSKIQNFINKKQTTFNMKLKTYITVRKRSE